METVESRILQAKFATSQAAAYWVNTDKLKLFTDPPANAQGLDIGDFTIADFTGYAGVALSSTWLHGLDALGRAIKKYSLQAVFTQTGVTITNVVQGWLITDTTDLILKAYGFFDSPVVMDTIGNQIVTTPYLFWQETANAEQEVIFGP